MELLKTPVTYFGPDCDRFKLWEINKYVFLNKLLTVGVGKAAGPDNIAAKSINIRFPAPMFYQPLTQHNYEPEIDIIYTLS